MAKQIRKEARTKSTSWKLYGLSVMMMVWMGAGIFPFSPVASASETELVVFAAASTTNAVTEVGEKFAVRNPGHIKTSFASSSTLAKQIANGAPVDVYISANKKWMDFLEEKNLLAQGSRFDLLSNRIVLIVPDDSHLEPVTLGPDFPLAAMLDGGRLSLGDPEHVPAGIYGKKALQSLAIWESVKDHLAPMKDVRAALTLVERGEAPVGLVYATDAAISKKVRVIGVFPEESHPPIVYPVAVMSERLTPAAERFLNFLKTPEARAVFEKYGFSSIR